MTRNVFRTSFIMLVLACGSIMGSQAQALNLFPPELRQEGDSVVLDFIDRYLTELSALERSGDFIAQRIADDGVIFSVGSPASARNITSELLFSLSRIEDSYYVAEWQDSTANAILSMSFPISFELLLGKPKVEIEKELREVLKSEPFDYDTACSIDSMAILPDGYMQTTPHSHYYVESVNTARYYQKPKNDSICPVFDTRQKEYSAANLFAGIIEQADDYMLYVDQSLYGFQSEQYMIHLSQWLHYCQRMNLTIYFGVEVEREDGLQALLIAQSKDLGFNHMLSIIIPGRFVEKKNTVMKAMLNAFIPTHNIKDLYQQYEEKNTRKTKK